MAAKVETLRIGTRTTSTRRGFVTRLGAAARRWVERGQLGQRGSSTVEMRGYTGAR
jgi:hypothetical protein